MSSILWHPETGDLFRVYSRSGNSGRPTTDMEVAVVDTYEFYGLIPEDDESGFRAVYRILEPLKSIIKGWLGGDSIYKVEKFDPDEFGKIRQEQPGVYFKTKVLQKRSARPDL